MRHRTKAVSFKGGIDASRMLKRKLMLNFLKHSTLTTTDRRAKTIKSELEKLITLAKVESESHKNMLLRFFADIAIVDVLFKQIGPAFASIQGGYLKVTHMGQREADASVMMKLEWAHPVSVNWGKEPKKVADKVAKSKALAS